MVDWKSFSASMVGASIGFVIIVFIASATAHSSDLPSAAQMHSNSVESHQQKVNTESSILWTIAKDSIEKASNEGKFDALLTVNIYSHDSILVVIGKLEFLGYHCSLYNSRMTDNQLLSVSWGR